MDNLRRMLELIDELQELLESERFLEGKNNLGILKNVILDRLRYKEIKLYNSLKKTELSFMNAISPDAGGVTVQRGVRKL